MEPSLIIKVQYGETLRRFSSRVVDGKLDLDMIALRKKVFGLFSFPAGSELDFTYVDEDGDVVKLADNEDLHDIMRQSLNPLRITVRLNTERTVGLRPHGRSSGSSTPVRSQPLQLPLQVGNTNVSEVLNSLPGTVRDTVSKFSTELGLETSSPAGYLVILDSLAKMGLTYLKEVSAAGAKSEPSESSTDAPVTKDKNSSISVGTTQVSELKSSDQGNGAGRSEGFVMPAVDNANAKDKSSIFLKNVAPNGNAAGKSEGFVIPAVGNANAKDKSPILPVNTAPNSFNDLKRQNDKGSQGSKVGKIGRSAPKMKSIQESYVSNPGWKSIVSPKPLTRNDSPFSSRPVPPYMQRHQLTNRVSPVKRSYNYSDVMGSVLHAGIQCDGCGVHPITGPRFKSKVKEDYDLCNNCFDDMGSEAEYIRMDLPLNYQNLGAFNFHYHHSLGRSPTLPADHAKIDSCFILDVNILDGTIMKPLTHFTKIWRMRNNGSVAWPHGTNLLWIGGDQLSKTLFCDLKIPAEGCPVDKEIDIAVDFTAPENPGRYSSFWRMASPSGHQFGQRVWVLIQVESALKVSNSKNRHDFNLNFPPVSSCSGMMGFPNINASVDPKIGDDLMKIDTPALDQGLDLPKNETLLVAEAKPDSATPETSSLVLVTEPPVTDLAVDPSKLELIAISVPQNSDMEDSSSMMEVNNGTDEVEQTLLKELENMGFTQVDLNKEILRKNEYDLEEALNELCDTEWDPMLAELQEMGFLNNEVNKKLLKKNNGSIKRVVMDLITGEEDA
ncbi:PB1 domain, Zinc finger, ZZ-type, UBA-like, Next to BRCA1, central domain protein [Heracleum sosnowskyi]|uniref:PB1 domain, Zinc finger, ZZ-type, UBA-like, Next to BRCA1, central domain protein n=1 Tax=Heracleum sosnowskyi TaxID=360622 RepID=A0AAD8HVT3_9APIA|nr:PB1 domain, Zinc finger, ZZ-type, UBA-like, Next to BRCA1, central domain protein [Heracleum sosnowskyi]